MARWTASAKWVEAPALDGQCDMPLALRLSEGLDRNSRTQLLGQLFSHYANNDIDERACEKQNSLQNLKAEWNTGGQFGSVNYEDQGQECWNQTKD